MGSLGHKTICFFKRLSSLREKGKLLDITLIVEDVHFKAHKIILSSYSDYFSAMFAHNMLESRQVEITLKAITAAGFGQVLEYFYTTNIIFDLSNVQDVLEASLYLQVPVLIEMCIDYLASLIDIDSCLIDIVTLAEVYSLEELKMEVFRFMSEHLLEFSKSKEFYRLTSQQFENLLSHDFCVDCCEHDVLRVVLAWFFHVDHPKEDFNHIIIHLIRFNQISPRKFENILEECFQGTNPELEWYREMLLEEYFQKSNNTESINSNLPRGMEMVIIQVGGRTARQNINFCSPKEGKWRHLTTIPDDFYDTCYYHIISVVNNELYITGSEEKSDFGIKFSPIRNEWKTTAPMKLQDRHHHTLNTLGNKLYAICGCTFTGNHQKTTKSCERYDPELNEWNMIATFPLAIDAHAAAAYESESDLKLFVSGGFGSGNHALSSMYCYIVSEDKWHRCAPMPEARFCHEMFSIGNYIYVCGGQTSMDYTSPVDTIDVYDVKNDSWKIITKVPTPRCDVGIVCFEHKIYFIGGSDADDQTVATTDCYDIEADLWTSENFNYPEQIDMFQFKCATILISKWMDYPSL